MSEQDQTAPATMADKPEAEAAGVAVRAPDFSTVQPTGQLGAARSLRTVYDVSVTVTAELGRVSMPISKLLQLGEGSVIELDRPVSTPIDLRAEGVLLARGEVVVVDDCFAVRLKEVTQPEAASNATGEREP